MTPESLQNKKYAFLGAGIIAGVFIERLVKSRVAEPAAIIATDLRMDRLEELKSQFGIQTDPDSKKAAAFGDIVFIAVPPNVVGQVLTEVGPELRSGTLIVSLAACIPTSYMEVAVGKPLPILRIIPNTPSLIGMGMNPYCLGKASADYDKRAAELLAVFGETVRVPEDLMNAATALTAVGPTYIFPVLQALQDAAEAHGLPPEIAARAAAQTVLGAAQMVLTTGRSPDDLKLMIGTRTLDEGAARSLFVNAMDAAYSKISQSQQKLTAAVA